MQKGPYVLLFMLLMVAVVSFQGCYYDTEEELYPQVQVCDTSQVTYSLSVRPVLDQNCMNCHSQAVQQGNIVLETYADVQGVAATGALLGAIRHDPGFTPMPQGGGKLNDCVILQIEKWIQSGSPNN
jgi:hypothetical protein